MLSGNINADLDNLTPVGALAGHALSGAARLDLDLSSSAGAQGAIVDLTTRNLAIAEPGGRWSIRQAALKGRFTDVFRRPAAKASSQSPTQHTTDSRSMRRS